MFSIQQDEESVRIRAKDRTSGTSATDEGGMMGFPNPFHRLAEEQVKTAQTRLAEAQYDYKIPEAMLAYSRGGRSPS
jgi:hypothetical protein